MIYVVSGFPRTGTSMMMRCLEAGGLTPAFSSDRERGFMTLGDDHYHPNQGGFHEVRLAEYGSPGFPLDYQDRLIKVLAWGLDSMAANPGGYRIVLMLRDPEEIRQSYEAAFGKGFNLPPDYWRRMEAVEARMRNRKDVHAVSVFAYRSVVGDPRFAFDQLAAEGWPVAVEAAVNVVDPAQCRFRKEWLVEGI
jgi:hypothetical protein